MAVPKKMLVFTDKFGELDKGRSSPTQAGAGTRLSKFIAQLPLFGFCLLLIEKQEGDSHVLKASKNFYCAIDFLENRC